MEPETKIWVFDPKVLEYLKFAEFSWWQVSLFFAAFAALGLYFFLGVLAHYHARARERRIKAQAQLDRWLAEWELTPKELDILNQLSGDPSPKALHRLLSHPARFETRVHQALNKGWKLPFAGKLRTTLGYHSKNPRIRIISTRQILPGEHFRFSVMSAGRPRHFYGQLVTNHQAGFSVEITEGGFSIVRELETETELFFLRDNDLEYRFPLVLRGGDPLRNRLDLAHQLALPQHKPRGIRLPLVRPMDFSVREDFVEEDVVAPNLDLVPAHHVRGVLLDLSDGGFSLVLPRAFPERCFISFSLTRPRGRELPVMGRALEIRSFGGNRFLIRCEVKGMSQLRRNLLYQVLHLEQKRRLQQKHDQSGKIRAKR